jgi:hypothetical protein
MEYDEVNNITLVDYAYENVANKPIAAGKSSVPLNFIHLLLLEEVQESFRIRRSSGSQTAGPA